MNISNRAVGYAIAVGVGAVFLASTTRSSTPPSEDAEVGRYHSSTTYRDIGNWVFVTVIDTRTGKVVSQERYNGFEDYKTKAK